MSLVLTAKDTLAILDAGAYTARSGRRVALRSAIDEAVEGTRLYRPGEPVALGAAPAHGRPMRVEVTEETTAAAGRRLVSVEGAPGVAALNFASAKNPGGGFLGGAKAQEEDLARASGLYPCLLRAPDYYMANSTCGSLLYTDHVIWSPGVPFFRDDAMALLERPYRMAVVTAPAPNAGDARRRGETPAAIRDALVGRARRVLQVCADQGQRTLVLGAWGCGVFRNDPVHVAEAFGGWLAHDEFAGRFDRVVFAVWDPAPGSPALDAFRRRFP